jgi:hypothetical protein
VCVRSDSDRAQHTIFACECFRESHVINGWQVWRWPLNLETKEEGLSTRPVRLLCAAAAFVVCVLITFCASSHRQRFLAKMLSFLSSCQLKDKRSSLGRKNSNLAASKQILAQKLIPRDLGGFNNWPGMQRVTSMLHFY